MEQYDLIIIGSGPGGYVAAIRAAQLDMKVAVVEKESLGGVCLNWGCIPTKALLKSAQVFEYINRSSDYGVSVSGAQVDFSAMIGRSRQVASDMDRGVQALLKKNKVDVLYGMGRLQPERTVVVTANSGVSQTYRAAHIIIATGGRNRELPQLPIDHKKIIGYREAMTLPEQPASIVIVGGGAIGVEFAYFYNAIGSRVTVVERSSRLLSSEDEEISEALGKAMSKAGIVVRTGAEVVEVDCQGEGCGVQLRTDAGTEVLRSDVVLSAVGVVANIEDIGLEEVGVATSQGKVVVDAYCSTNVPGIYAIGDVIAGPSLAHVASAEGILCVEKLAGLSPDPIDYNNLPSCTYCQPEVASVGYTERSAREAGYDVKVGKFPFAASGKARAAGHPEGFVKVIFDAKYGEWLGAHMIGAHVTEMIAEVVTARKLETTAAEVMKSVHPHPTMSEAIMEAAAAAYGEVIHL